MMSGEPTTSRRDPLPADFLCPACGYDLSAARVERCSECGLEIDDEILAADERRKDYLNGKYHADLWLGLSPVAAMMTLAITSVAYSTSDRGLNVVVGAVLGGLAITPGAFLSAIIAAGVPQGLRKCWFWPLFGAQAVCQLPIIMFAVASGIVNNVERLVSLPSPLGLILLDLGTLSGFLLLTRIWNPMWKWTTTRAGLVETPILKRRVRMLSFVSAIPSLFWLCYLILGTIITIFIGDNI